MEAALGVAALVTVLVVCLAAVTAVSAQIRCVDAAREAARLAARGDDRAAVRAASAIAPAGAAIQIRPDGEFLVATVTARSALWPALAITAVQFSAREPQLPRR